MIKIEALCTKNEDFDQTYLNTGSKTQNVEGLSLDLILHNPGQGSNGQDVGVSCPLSDVGRNPNMEQPKGRYMEKTMKKKEKKHTP